MDYEETKFETSKHQMLGPEKLNKKFLEAFGWENDVVDEDVAQQLLEDGADINARGQNKMRPLQFAARYGDEKRPEDVWRCVKWIIDKLQNNQTHNQYTEQSRFLHNERRTLI